jgi:hypothetical protein
LLFFGCVAKDTLVFEGVLCLGHATNFVKPRPDLFGFTISNVTYHLQEADPIRCQEWTVAIEGAINEAKHLRHSLEVSEGYKAVLDWLDAEDVTNIINARSAAFSTSKDKGPLPATAPTALERNSFSQVGHDSQQRVSDDASPERATLGDYMVMSANRGQNVYATPTSKETSKTSKKAPRVSTATTKQDSSRVSTATIKQDSSRVSTSTPTQAGPAKKDVLANRLNTYFVSEHLTPRQYTDIDIQEICALLKLQAPRWSRVPRTYVVLRIIGQLDLLDACIDLGVSDY